MSSISRQGYSVDGNGGAHISCAAIAELTGVTEEKVLEKISDNEFYKVKRNGKDEIQSRDAFFIISYFAAKDNLKAKRTLIDIGSAGMRFYIYNECGYQIESEENRKTRASYDSALLCSAK